MACTHCSHLVSSSRTPNKQEYSSNKPLQTPPFRGEKPVRKLIRPAIRGLARHPPHTHPDRANYPPRARRRTLPGCIPGSSTSSSAQRRRDGPPRLGSLPPSRAALSGRAPASGRGFDEQRPDRVGRVVERREVRVTEDRDQSRAQPLEYPL